MALGNFVLASIGIGLACFALAKGLPGRAEVFAQPAPTAFERLRTKQAVINGTGLGSLTIRSAGTDKGSLLLSVAKAGEPRSATCRITVSPVSPTSSRAEIDCVQPGGADAPIRRVATEALTIVMREHVASTIEDRRYDIDGVADRMIAFAVMNRPAFAASLPPLPK